MVLKKKNDKSKEEKQEPLVSLSDINEKKEEHPMRKIFIEKITLNIGTGTDGNLEHAKKILKDLTGVKPKVTTAKKRNPFGGAKGKPLGCMVTVRNNQEKMLNRLLTAVENKISASSFDDNGNFSFGIKEYINIPDMKYDPNIGIIGMDVCVTLVRPGFKIRKKRLSRKIGKKHRITKTEAIRFAESIGVNVVQKE